MIVDCPEIASEVEMIDLLPGESRKVVSFLLLPGID